jgi:hypothetical protein
VYCDPPKGCRLKSAVAHLPAEAISTTEERLAMIVLGLILLVAGFVLKISILWTIGIILLVIGAVLAVLGTTGRAVGGRRHYN